MKPEQVPSAIVSLFGLIVIIGFMAKVFLSDPEGPTNPPQPGESDNQ